MVHRREIDGEIVAFGHQGSVWQNAQAIFDHKTGSVWAQPYGEAFMGDLAGYELELLQYTMTTWAQWRDLHPETLAYAEPIEAEEETLDDSAIVVESAGEAVAYPLTELRSVGVVNDAVGTDPVPIAVVLADADDLAWRVYARQGPDGEEMDLVAGEAPDEIVDTVSGTTFHAYYGYGISGPFDDYQLAAIPVSTIFTDQFLDYYPDGRIWSA